MAGRARSARRRLRSAARVSGSAPSPWRSSTAVSRPAATRWRISEASPRAARSARCSTSRCSTRRASCDVGAGDVARRACTRAASASACGGALGCRSRRRARRGCGRTGRAPTSRSAARSPVLSVRAGERRRIEAVLGEALARDVDVEPFELRRLRGRAPTPALACGADDARLRRRAGSGCRRGAWRSGRRARDRRSRATSRRRRRRLASADGVGAERRPARPCVAFGRDAARVGTAGQREHDHRRDARRRRCVIVPGHAPSRARTALQVSQALHGRSSSRRRPRRWRRIRFSMSFSCDHSVFEKPARCSLSTSASTTGTSCAATSPSARQLDADDAAVVGRAQARGRSPWPRAGRAGASSRPDRSAASRASSATVDARQRAA